MKSIINTILFVIIFTNLLFSQSIKILSKSLSSTESLSIGFTDKVEIKKTYSSHPNLLTTIETNLPSATLDVLTKAGRYDIQVVVENGKTILIMPNLKNKIKIGDKEIIEKISCELSLPNSQNIDFQYSTM